MKALAKIFHLLGKPGCKVSDILDEIADVIRSLFTMSEHIDFRGTQDIYFRAEARASEKLDDKYDVNYVKDKFFRNSAEPWLLERLGKAITKRRQ